MIWMNCSCENSCNDPNGLNGCIRNCTDDPGYTCVCPDGFLIRDGTCVHSNECGCYHRDVGVIPVPSFNLMSIKYFHLKSVIVDVKISVRTKTIKLALKYSITLRGIQFALLSLLHLVLIMLHFSKHSRGW